MPTFAQPQRLAIADQHAEDPAPARELADRPVRLLVDPRREEALEPLAALVEHADRRVAGARQLARDVEHAREDGLRIELGDQRAPDVEQPPEPPFIHDARLTTLKRA